VPFHVELSSPMSHARLFNLSREELRACVIEPWLAGRAFELAESEWEPRESALKILEGRHLDNPDLPQNTMADAERWAAGLTRSGYAIDDETAIKVVDGVAEVISEGHWRLFES